MTIDQSLPALWYAHPLPWKRRSVSGAVELRDAEGCQMAAFMEGSTMDTLFQIIERETMASYTAFMDHITK